MTSLSDRLMPHLRRVALSRDPAPLTDGQLLGAFMASRDAPSFELLVRRHGPMVWGVCKRVIGHTQSAEDAFQAVFVVLARKAASVKPREQLPNWLFKVAYRAATKARSVLIRQHSREKQVDAMPEVPITPARLWSEIQPILDAELAALPDRLRLPVVLCDLEGFTHREAARRLKLPPATLSTRLTAARRKLAQRLTARGVTLSGGLLATVLSANVGQAAVSATVCTAGAKAGLTAIGAATGVLPESVCQLSEGVLRMMMLAKLKTITIFTLSGLMLLSGLGFGTLPQTFAQGPAQATPAKTTLGPTLSDADFLKRNCETLRGTPATSAEISYFVEDKDPAKRKKVVGWLTEPEQHVYSVIVPDKWFAETPTIISDVMVYGEAKNGEAAKTDPVANYLSRAYLSDDIQNRTTVSEVLIQNQAKPGTPTPQAKPAQVTPVTPATPGSTAKPVEQAARLGVFTATADPQNGEPTKPVPAHVQGGRQLELKLAVEKPTAEADKPMLARIQKGDNVIEFNELYLAVDNPSHQQSDADFLNMAITETRGSAPTRLEREYFLADKSAKKREKLLDTLLADPTVAKKVGPEWKKTMLNPPKVMMAFITGGGQDWTKLITSLLAAKKTDDQILEALTLAINGRLAKDSEKKLAAALVAKQKDKAAGWNEVASLLAGTDDAKKHADKLKNKEINLQIEMLNFNVELDQPKATAPAPKPVESKK